MEKLKYYIEKYKIIVFTIVIILLIGAIVYSIVKTNKVEVTEDIEIKEEVKEEKEEIFIEKLKVDIKGQVLNPGVYELDNNSRIIDVINKAGGLLDTANTEYINLSKKIKDEMIIIIYSNNEIEKFKETKKEIIYIEYECICPDNINDSCINESDTVNTNGIVKENSSDNKVSINLGTLEELMTLSGIGESKAKSIIEYREKNGEFKNLEDLMNVSGIGESAYSKIKDNIKL